MNHSGFSLKKNLTSSVSEPREADDFIDVERLAAMLFRQARVLILCALLGLGLGVVYLMTTPPLYTANSQVLIDENLARIVDERTSFTSEMQTDSAMQSQIEIIRSTRLAEAVVDSEGLDKNDSFLEPPTSLLSRTIGYARWMVHFLLSGGEAPEEEVPESEAVAAQAKRQAAVLQLQRQLMAGRAGRSQVIAIGFRSHDPALAASITNAYAKAYVADQLNASFEATEEAALWMEGRLTELRQSSQAAALAVERYRAEHGLSAASGELMTDRRLSDLNSQLAIAKADTARAYARYQQYQTIVEGGPDEAVRNTTIAEEQSSDSVLNTLRTRYLNVTRREQEITNQFGADHQQAVALRREKAEIANQIHGELSQLAVSYRNEYQVALSREKALQESVQLASGENSEAKQSQVQLRELEQQANALSSLYQSFLTRYEEANQRSTFPISKARIITTAGVPRSPSSPSTTLVLGLGLVLGLMMGGAFGALSEFNERFFRTGDDVRNRLGARFLGYLPLFPFADPKKTRHGRKDPPLQPVTASAPDRPARTKPETRFVITSPASAFAETLRSAKFAGDVVLQGTQSKVIGIVSALPGEGKSTVAANFAQLLAANGQRTLLVDADLRNPGLSRSLGISAEMGLLEAVLNGQSWRSVAKFDSETRLAVVPAMLRSQFSHTSELLASSGMRRFLQEARDSFDYIVVDLPPLGPVIDAKAFAPLADGLLVVVEWGRTPRALVRSVLGSEPAVAERVLGVVLNKVNMKALSRYGGFGSSEKYVGQYASYYLDEKDKPAKAA